MNSIYIERKYSKNSYVHVCSVCNLFCVTSLKNIYDIYGAKSLFYHSHVSNACDTCKVFKDCLLFINTKIFSHCKCFGYLSKSCDII